MTLKLEASSAHVLRTDFTVFNKVIEFYINCNSRQSIFGFLQIWWSLISNTAAPIELSTRAFFWSTGYIEVWL